jgi:hypothetical protein
MNARHTAGLAAALLLLAGCSTEPSNVAEDASNPTADSASSPAEQTSAPVGNTLAGTYATDPIAVSQMVDVARQAGFVEKDLAEFRDIYAGVRQVVYTLKLTDTFWVLFESRDGGVAQDAWSGPYQVLDDATISAGTPPCGPITYDYSFTGDELSLDMTEDECREGGDQDAAPVGELIAQTTIYESAPYHRIS